MGYKHVVPKINPPQNQQQLCKLFVEVYTKARHTTTTPHGQQIPLRQQARNFSEGPHQWVVRDHSRQASQWSLVASTCAACRADIKVAACRADIKVVQHALARPGPIISPPPPQPGILFITSPHFKLPRLTTGIPGVGRVREKATLQSHTLSNFHS